MPLAWILDGVSEDVMIELPALAFLLRHSTNGHNVLFDLGIRQDWENLPPGLVFRLTTVMRFVISVQQDVVGALAKGGLQPSDISHICISHLHFDHFGDSAPFSSANFIVGESARPLVENGYPGNPNSAIPSNLLPAERTTFLDPQKWPPVGPFPHALDFYGDGSLYIVDAGAGHMPGHVNVLARTSADGGWIYLAGDSAHHWAILRGEAQMGHSAVFGCAHANAEEAQKHIERIRTLVKTNPRVRVLLAHDEPWYKANKDGMAFAPGRIETL